MYDALTTRYTFACPARGETTVGLSAFREVDRIPGDTTQTLDECRTRLYSSDFDARRLQLE
jgi:hypothetical protein